MFKIFARTRAGSAPSQAVPEEEMKKREYTVGAERLHPNGSFKSNRIIICEDDPAAISPAEPLPFSLSLGGSSISSSASSSPSPSPSIIHSTRHTNNVIRPHKDDLLLGDEDSSKMDENDDGEDPLEGSKSVGGIWISRSFLENDSLPQRSQSGHASISPSNRREHAHARAASTSALSTSAPILSTSSRSTSSSCSRLSYPDESFGRKIPKHVATQERMFAFVSEKRKPEYPIRYPTTVVSSPLSPQLRQKQPITAPTTSNITAATTPTTITKIPQLDTYKEKQKETAVKISNVKVGAPKAIKAELKGLLEVCNELKAKHLDVYRKLLQSSSNPDEGDSVLSSSASLIMRGQKSNNQILHAISNDVARTFRDSEMFHKTGSEGQAKLYRILSAYAIHSPSVGYCQGINFVVAGLLLAGFDEEESFWALHHLMKKHYLEGMYLPGLPGVKKALKRFEAWFSSLMPNLYAHFENEGIKTEMFTSKWFMSLYAAVLPIDMVVKIWHSFLLNGWIVIWSAGLALLSYSQDVLMKSNFEDILVYIQAVGKHITAEDQESVMKQMNVFMVTMRAQKEQLRLLQAF